MILKQKQLPVLYMKVAEALTEYTEYSGEMRMSQKWRIDGAVLHKSFYSNVSLMRLPWHLSRVTFKESECSVGFREKGNGCICGFSLSTTQVQVFAGTQIKRLPYDY